jgi:hypothetical protein
MAEPIDLVQQALNALADAGLGNDSPAEAFVIGYQAGASREITEEEIAAAMAETRKFITLPGAWMENIIRIAFDAARRKAMEG